MGTEAARSRANPLWPAICETKKGSKTVFAVEGFPHWSQSELCRGSECYISLYQANAPDGSPLESNAPDRPGFVPLSVPMKNVLGMGLIEKPKMTVTSRSDEVQYSRTTGVVAKDSLALQLSDGSVVNNRVRIRAFFKVADVNGTCALKYLGGVRLP